MSAASPTGASIRELGKTTAVVLAFGFGIACGVAGRDVYAERGARVTEWISDYRTSHAGPWTDAAAAVPVSSDDPSWGDRDALVTVTVFSDFQDVNSRRVEGALKDVRDAYSPRDVRIVWKNDPLPMHAGARAAAEAAQGVFALAGRRAFWRFHDLLFANPDDFGPDSFVYWAEKAGVPTKDLGRFHDALASHAWAAKIDADLKVVHDVPVLGTPTIYVNGALVERGAQPFALLKRMIDDQMAAAADLVAHGSPRTAVYVRASLENEKRWPHEQKRDSDPKRTATAMVK